MVCSEIRFSKKSYFMQINSLFCIANQLIGCLMIRGFTGRRFFSRLYMFMHSLNISIFNIRSLRLCFTYYTEQKRAIDFFTIIFTGQQETLKIEN